MLSPLSVFLFNNAAAELFTLHFNKKTKLYFLAHFPSHNRKRHDYEFITLCLSIHVYALILN